MELNSIFHYGVKGMKWGVRRSQAQLDKSAGRKTSGTRRRSVNRLQRVGARTSRVAKGTGSIRDTIAELAVTPPIRLLTSKGLKGAANKNLESIKKDIDKLESGSRGIRAIRQMSWDANLASVAYDSIAARRANKA